MVARIAYFGFEDGIVAEWDGAHVQHLVVKSHFWLEKFPFYFEDLTEGD